MSTGRHEVFENGDQIAANMRVATERPNFSSVIPQDIQAEINSLTDEAWLKIIAPLDDPNSMESIDWTDTEAPASLETRLTRLSSIKANLPANNRILQKDQHNITLENYKKLALATAGNLPTLNVFLEILRSKLQAGPSPEAAQTVFDVWADTAEIIGRHDIKTDLEEAAFSKLMPDAYATVSEAYDHLGGDADMEVLVSDYSDVLGSILSEEMGPDVNFKIDGRRKSYFSVWRKVEKDKRSSYMLPDFLGLRIVVVIEDGSDDAKTLGDCYAVAGLISQVFEPDLKRYKDYIANPKPNGYRSLHLTVKDLSGAQIEFQVRTDSMHQQAQTDPGISHRAYEASTKITPGKYFRNLAKPHRIYNWRDEAAKLIKQRTESGSQSLEDLSPGTVLAFAEDNNLYQLNEDETVLDFAFSVHSRHALKLRYAHNKGSSASLELDQPVQFGQILKLATYRDRRLTWEDSWLDKVRSTKAKKALAKATSHRDQETLIANGTKKLDDSFKAIMRHKGVRDKLNADQLETLAALQDVAAVHELLSEDRQDEIAKDYGLPDFDTLLRVIGQGSLNTGRLVNFVRDYLDLTPDKETPVAETAAIGKIAIEGEASDPSDYKIAIHGAFGFKHHFAGCCQINTGDDIRASWSQRSGDFALHLTDCSNLATKATAWDCTWH